MAKKNSFLKKGGGDETFTGDQVLEYQKCIDDPIYFISTYCRLQHPVLGDIPFSLFPFQRRTIDTFHKNRLVIVLASRQVGKSWMAGAYILWYSMFKKDKTVIIASNKESNAMEMVHRIRFMYERIPEWLKAGLTSDGWNKHAVAFDNGSRVMSEATSDNTGRGKGASLLFLDEFAFVRDNIQEEFWSSAAPTLATGGDCIICSTPNGDTNRFAQLWRGAQIQYAQVYQAEKEEDTALDGADFVPVQVKWNEPPGRDEKFKAAEIRKIGEVKWKQEYECCRGTCFVDIQDELGNEKSIEISKLYELLMDNQCLV